MFLPLKHRLRGFMAPAIFLAVTYYFGWNAVHGENGLQAQIGQRAALREAQATLAATGQERATWQTRVAALAGQSIAPDMLDEQARHMLGLAEPNDLVVDLKPPASGK